MSAVELVVDSVVETAAQWVVAMVASLDLLSVEKKDYD